MTTKPNILLVVLDSVQAKHTSLLGYHRKTTPFLENLATDSTVYKHAYAPSSRTIASHASIFTGLSPVEHQIGDKRDKLNTEHVFGWLRSKHNYQTGIFSNNPFLTRIDNGLSTQFDTVKFTDRLPFNNGLDPDKWRLENKGGMGRYLGTAIKSDDPIKSVCNGVSWKLQQDYPDLARRTPEWFAREDTAFAHTERFLRWASEVQTSFAACLNLMDAHSPYRPASEYDLWANKESRSLRKSISMKKKPGQKDLWKHQLMADAYDGTIREIDTAIESLVNSLQKQGLLNNTALIITADHGEVFSKYSYLQKRLVAGHGPNLHNDVVHVPLLTALPYTKGGETVSEPVSLRAFPKLVRDLVGGGQSPTFVSENPVISATSINNDEALAVYIKKDSIIERQAVWNDTEVTTHHPTVDTSYYVNNAAPKAKKLKNGLSPVGVAASTDIKPGVEQRLKDLGYK